MYKGIRIMRLSRISHPRGTLIAMILLAVAFLGFGLVAEAQLPAASVVQFAELDAGRWHSARELLTGFIPGF